MNVDENTPKGKNLLRLLALDEQDLDVISANLQGSLVKRGDVHYLPSERRFVLALHRLDLDQEDNFPHQRHLAAMHFEHVLAVRHRNLGETPDVLHTLLAVYFIPGEAPAGAVILEFADGAAIRLDVECLEAQMKDLGSKWDVESQPGNAQMENNNADDS